jgi:aryl-alcohol dehydrogenase-like predicted oxidoreductase
MNKIILGTAQIGMSYGINNQTGKPSENDSIAVLNEAYRRGIRKLDTADTYGDAIDIVGRYHAGHNKFNILNKFSLSDGNTDIIRKVERALRILRINEFEVYSYHSFNDFIANNKISKILMKLKKEKLIKKIGISIYTNQEFETGINSEMIDVIQIPFNILDNNNKKGSLITKAKQNGKEIHTRSVFLQGLFFMDEGNIISKLRPLVPYINKVKSFCEIQGMSINKLSLMYAISNPNIDGVLVGVDSVEQLKENISYLKPDHIGSIIKFVETLDVKEVELLNPVSWKQI